MTDYDDRWLSDGYKVRIVAALGKFRAYVGAEASNEYTIGKTGWCKTRNGAIAAAHRVADRNRALVARLKESGGLA